MCAACAMAQISLSTQSDSRADIVVVTADPALVPAASEPFTLPADADVEEQLNAIAAEINRLRTAAARVTLIINPDMELAPQDNLSGTRITISKGVFGKKESVSCTTRTSGTCVFLLHPVTGKTPPYEISISSSKYVTLRQEIKPEPGAVLMLSPRVEMTPAERDRRVNPR